ncbi:MAG: GIY-YIG nuclease family protein [Bacteroidetes bacterium]|nr:MAG: GIY-YIG nuclease family protein [Bacteroidota bacterium]MBL1145820.1 GIY-YIG nuclease family protein [Bacteroidota bacterium]NOG58614.1 GIY-YIG nuclease family protein [Bacteroidota bacterium]
MKRMYVYMMTNKNNNVLYTGVTNNLERRIKEHRSTDNMGFTGRYKCHKLVYFEIYDSPMKAINREKQIKAGSRKKKNELIEKENIEWKDLSADWD